MNALTTTTQAQNNIMLVMDGSKDKQSHLAAYADWLNQNQAPWYLPDLPAYAEYLKIRPQRQTDENPKQGLSSASIKVHLTHIRTRYQELCLERDLFFSLIPDNLDFVTRKSMVDEMITRLQNALAVKVDLPTATVQDVVDSQHIRLTPSQANALIAAPNRQTLAGLRDSAMFALMLATGIRADELIHLEVDDLRQQLGGELALLVKHGKGNKQRAIPYGDLDGCLVVVDAWLKQAGITSGRVFRSVRKGGKVIGNALTVRAVEKIFEKYPINIDGVMRTITPHDTRRTYAARQHEAGLDPVAIQQNLGHSDLKTTMGYIGELLAYRRRGKAVYDFGLQNLGGLF